MGRVKRIAARGELLDSITIKERAMTASSRGFTGRTRRLRTSWRVRLSDFIARWMITIGGIGTIVAVLAVFLFLFAVVCPLFFHASLTLVKDRPTPWAGNTPMQLGVDEYQTLGW